MRTEDCRLLNILYAPLGYIHSDNLSSAFSLNNIISDTLLNYWIISQYKLDNLPDYWRPEDPISLLIIPNWDMIPKIAYLLGGYILRERLLIDRATLITDLQLLSFISLPLQHTITICHEYDNFNYSTCGATFIMGIAKMLPFALQQRLRLFFSPIMDFPKMKISISPDNINLLKMAIIYARNSFK